MLLYFTVLSIIFLLLVFRIYIKKLSSFWSIQPVFHVYNVLGWFKPRGVIEMGVPKFNKYCNIINVQTRDMNIITDLQRQIYTNFIKTHYLNSTDTKYLPTENEIFPFFTGLNQPCYISIYEKPSFLIPSGGEIEINDKKLINNNKLLGLMTSRPLIMTLVGGCPLSIYYVDYLCVDTSTRKGGIAPQIIQTHIYNERRMNANINISFFKRESQLTNIVPITGYATYKLPLAAVPHEILPIASIKLVKITKDSIRLLMQFIFKQKDRFKCIIVPDLGNILTLIETGNLIIYGLMENQELCSCYIFRNSMVYYNGERSIDFVASISNVCFIEYFYIGFCKSVHKICKELSATQISYEMISDNTKIFNKYFIQNHNKTVSPTAYYFYNYRMKTIESDDVFIFC